jgi:hydrogenase maturation protease
VNTLVIGYGNDLRSDDGAGRVVADRVERLDLPGVAVRSVSQLVPELALEIAEADAVIFVDASIDAVETTAVPVSPTPAIPSATTHYADPATLLAMSANIGPVPAEAYLVSIPVTNLDLGFDLSPTTEQGVELAVDLVVNLIRSK